MAEIQEAIQWLKASKSISVTDEGQLVLEDRTTRFSRWMDPDKDTMLKKGVIDHITARLKASPRPEEAQDLTELGRVCLKAYASDRRLVRIMKGLDRTLSPFREEKGFEHPGNKADQARWIRYKYKEDVFYKYPNFVHWFLNTPLASQMKVTRDNVGEVDGEGALMVEGKWVPFSRLKERFAVEFAPAFNEKFVIDKKSREVYTYLDNGLGLQKHHPYLEKQPIPFSTLDQHDYSKVLEVAKRFVRPDEQTLSQEAREKKNQDRDFVFQIVSSYVDGHNWNVDTFLRRRKHPWIRIIIGRDNEELGTKKGEVYEVGFGWEKRVKVPSITTKGRFRGQDLWNYKTPQQRIVTNIAISQEEARSVFEYGIRYHRDSINLGRHIGFQLAHQNCSVFVRFAAAAAGIEVPTEIPITQLIYRIAPTILQRIGTETVAAKDMVWDAMKNVASCLPQPVDQVVTEPVRTCHCVASETFARAGAVLLGVGRCLTGGALGRNGRAFVHDGEDDRDISPPSRNPFSWVKLSDYRINLPSVLQEWQVKQPSTVVYQKPVKLSIVPPDGA